MTAGEFAFPTLPETAATDAEVAALAPAIPELPNTPSLAVVTAADLVRASIENIVAGRPTRHQPLRFTTTAGVDSGIELAYYCESGVAKNYYGCAHCTEEIAVGSEHTVLRLDRRSPWTRRVTDHQHLHIPCLSAFIYAIPELYPASASVVRRSETPGARMRAAIGRSRTRRSHYSHD